MPSPPRPSIHAELEAAERFAARFPHLAGALGGPPHESSVERMREALIYLGAVVTAEIHALEHEGYRALGDTLAPDLVRPLPAATVVELATDGPRVRVQAGAEVETPSTPACRFRTVSEVDVGPWRIEGARIERGRSEEALCFDLVATGPAPLSEVLPPFDIRIFVAGPRESALSLVSQVLGHTARVEVEADGLRGAAGPARASRDDANEALAPEPDGPPNIAGLLREYFVLPEKFAFFLLCGVAEALPSPGARRAAVRVVFDDPVPARAAPSPDALRAHCSAAVNLFRAASEPRIVGPSGFRFPLRVAGCAPREGGVYAVLGVRASPLSGEGPSVTVPPLRRFAAAEVSDAFPYAYALAPARGEAAEDRVLLSVVAPERWDGPGARTPDAAAPHVISVDLLATNRDAGSQVRPGELCKPGLGLPAGVRARNIVPTSAYVRAPVGPEFALRVAVRGALPRADPLASLQAFLLAQVPRHGLGDSAVRAALGRVDAILHLEVATRVTPSGHGYLVTLAIDESRFSGAGDVALFLRLLHQTLEAHGTINHPYRCEALLTKSAARIAWPPEPRP